VEETHRAGREKEKDKNTKRSEGENETQGRSGEKMKQGGDVVLGEKGRTRTIGGGPTGWLGISRVQGQVRKGKLATA